MRVDLLTREYPPEVYGGAGVHVAELVRALRRDLDVVVRCFGAPREEAGLLERDGGARVFSGEHELAQAMTRHVLDAVGADAAAMSASHG